MPEKMGIASAAARGGRQAVHECLSMCGFYGGNTLMFVDVMCRVLSKQDGVVTDEAKRLCKSLEVMVEPITKAAN